MSARRKGRKRKSKRRRAPPRKRTVTRTTTVRVVESNPHLLIPLRRGRRDLRLHVQYPGEAVPRGFKAPRTAAERSYAARAAVTQRRAGRAFATMLSDLAGARDRLARAGG